MSVVYININEKLKDLIRFKILKIRVKNIYNVNEEELLNTICFVFNTIKSMTIKTMRYEVIKESDDIYINHSIDTNAIIRFNIFKQVAYECNYKNLNTKSISEYTKEVVRFCFNESCFLFEEEIALFLKKIFIDTWNEYYNY